MFGPDIIYQFMISVVLTIFSVLTPPAQAESESDKCSKCVDSEGNKCDDMERFEQSNYWIPTEDALGFGANFNDAKKGCIQRGFTIAELISGNNDLERVFRGTGFDAFWMVKLTGDELKPVAVNKQGTPSSDTDLDTQSSYICQFTDNSGCFKTGKVMEQVQTTEKNSTTEKIATTEKNSTTEKIATTEKNSTTEKIATTEKNSTTEKIATTEKNSTTEKISTNEKIATTEKISTTEKIPTTEESTTTEKRSVSLASEEKRNETDPLRSSLPKNRRKCTNILHGNRLSLRSRK